MRKSSAYVSFPGCHHSKIFRQLLPTIPARSAEPLPHRPANHLETDSHASASEICYPHPQRIHQPPALFQHRPWLAMTAQLPLPALDLAIFPHCANCPRKFASRRPKKAPRWKKPPRLPTAKSHAAWSYSKYFYPTSQPVYVNFLLISANT